MSRRAAGDLLLRVPPVGESAALRGGGGAAQLSAADQELQLLQRPDVREEAWPTFNAPGSLGLTLSETRIDTVYSGTLIHLDAVSADTQAAFPDLRPDQLLIKVNGDSILGMTYDSVTSMLKGTRPLTLTFASSPHVDDVGPDGAAAPPLTALPAPPPAPGEEYTVRLPTGGSFGFNLCDDGGGDVVIHSFSNEKPEAAGVVPGSLLLWVQGIGVRGQGNEGVQHAIAQCAGAPSVEFVLQAPVPDVELDIDELMPFIPFDCVFEDSRPLGLSFELHNREDGTPAALVISAIETGTQADKYTYLRAGMEVTQVDAQSIAGLDLKAAQDRCAVRPVTLTLIDPQLRAAAGMEHVQLPVFGAQTSGDEAPDTPNILDRVDALLAVGPAVGGARAEDAVGSQGYGSQDYGRHAGSESPPGMRNALRTTSTGPLRERRRWRQDEGGDLSERSPPADDADPASDEHDDLLRRIDELYSRQANRTRPQMLPARSQPARAAETGRVAGAGWGTRIAAASAAPTASSWRTKPASHGGSESVSLPPNARDDTVEAQIEARRRAREARRQGREGSSVPVAAGN
jgi:hypothetical protein